jgi:hypothetical protein
VAENSREQIWPALDYSEWRETCATLQLWTQIVGKIRLALGPWINHSWGVTLYVTVRGLTTSLIPYGSRAFEIEFDFTRHELRIITAEGDERVITLQPQSVANFYRQVMANLRELGVEVQIGMKRWKRSRSIMMRNTPLTIWNMPTAFGACSCRQIVFSKNFVRVSAASAVRCIFSGAVSIWR